MRYRFKGIIPPMLTAFTEDGAFDKESTRNIAHFLKDKVQGLFICGTYGSGPLLEVKEKKMVIDTVMEEVEGKIPVIVHVGSTYTSAAIDVAKFAERAGVSAIASVSPYYYSHNETDIISYFAKLVDSVSVPVYVYNNPKTVGYSISPSLLEKLYDIGVQGLKDSSFSLVTFFEFVDALGDKDFEFIIGTEALIVGAYVLGARGIISGVANALPEFIVDLYNACESGDMEKASRLQLLALRLRKLLHISSSISVTHSVLKLRGVNAGFPRHPFTPLSHDKEKLLERELKKLGVL